jgi:hypothetical protein
VYTSYDTVTWLIINNKYEKRETKTKNTTLGTVAKSYNKIGGKGKSDSVSSHIHNFLAHIDTIA